jgi:protein TonB
MATLFSAGSPPERRRIWSAAALALLAEALLFGAGFVTLEHKQAPPVIPQETLLSIAAVPEPKPEPATPAPQPQARPQSVVPRIPPVHQVTHVARPRPRPEPAPPVPAAVPEPATPANPPSAAAPKPPPPAAAAPAGPSPSFESAMRAAIQAALRYPESARMAGMAGRTRVAFQYRDGEISGVTLITSSGSGMLDRAALAAVRDAAYPKPEAALVGKTLNEQLWVTFNLNASE